MQKSTDSNVLYWPITLLSGVKDKEFDYLHKYCYAIGWYDEATVTSIPVSVSSDSQSTRCTRRTIIVAGLIPAKSSASTSDESPSKLRRDDKDGIRDEDDKPSDHYFYSLPRIEESLKILKETLYPCVCSGPGCYHSHNEERGEVDESNVFNDNKCDSCDIVRGLKVVARWNCTNNDSANVKACDDDIYEKMDAKRNKIMSLPRIEFTQNGREIKIIFEFSADAIARKSSQNVTSATDTILFKPCRVQSLDHYRHVSDSSYCRNFHLFKGHDTGNSNENCQGKKGKQTDFNRMLMRISETESVMQDLQQVLQNRNPRQEFSKHAITSKENIVTSTSRDDSKHDTHDVPVAPVEILSYVLIIRHWRINARLGPNGRFLSAVGAQSSLISMIKSILKIKSKSNVQSMFIPREKRALLRLKRNREFIAQIIDVTLGILCGYQLLRKQIRDTSISSVSKLWTLSHEKLLQKNISWLETFPAGFKLNVPLTKVMGRAILWFTQTYEEFLGGSFSGATAHWLLGFLGIISIIFGFRTMISYVHDLSKLATIHVYIVARAFQNIFQTQLSLFSSLWHLFCGKKKNIIRQRSDMLEYDFMQLFLGMILFAICLFLFTTVLVYYSFFTFVHLIVRFCVGALWWTYFFMTYFPFGDVFTSLTMPGMFATQVSFGDNKEERIGDACSSGQSCIRARFVLDYFRPSTMAIIVESVSQVMKKAMVA